MSSSDAYTWVHVMPNGEEVRHATYAEAKRASDVFGGEVVQKPRPERERR